MLQNKDTVDLTGFANLLGLWKQNLKQLTVVARLCLVAPLSQERFSLVKKIEYEFINPEGIKCL